MKTPKEKAYELSMRFDKEGETDNAVKCALICVEEILKNQPYDIYTVEQSNNVNEYWAAVKTEIEKL